MVHNVFDSVQILRDDCPVKIASVGLWGAHLLLGCIDGSLRIYAPDDVQESQSSSLSYTLKATRLGFAKKAVTQMDVLLSRGLLITLSDAVAIHALPQFDAVSCLTKTEGATLYTWYQDGGLLAVAKKNIIYAYRFYGNREFIELKELAAPDVVKTMAWCSDSLCLGIRQGYVIMNISTGVTVDIFPCGRIAGPLIVALPQGALLLGKDNIGVITDCNGKLMQEGVLNWSEVPGAVIIHSPYALACSSRFIEVRSLRAPHGLVQMLPIRDVNLLVSTDAGVVAASDHSVYRILPIPLGVQVVQLAASSSFETLPPEDAASLVVREDAVHTHAVTESRGSAESDVINGRRDPLVVQTEPGTATTKRTGPLLRVGVAGNGSTGGMPSSPVEQCIDEDGILDLTSAQLHSLKDIELPDSLLELDLTANRLTEVDERLGKMNLLKKLSLRQNLFEDAAVEVLTRLPALFGIQEVILRDNRLTKVPSMSAFTCLTVFDISFNKISSMKGISQVTAKLRELYISNNSVVEIVELEHLRDLQILELGANKIRQMNGIQKQTALKELWLGRNRIRAVDLCGLTGLTRISLQSNRLTSMLGFEGV